MIVYPIAPHNAQRCQKLIQPPSISKLNLRSTKIGDAACSVHPHRVNLEKLVLYNTSATNKVPSKLAMFKNCRRLSLEATCIARNDGRNPLCLGPPFILRLNPIGIVSPTQRNDVWRLVPGTLSGPESRPEGKSTSNSTRAGVDLVGPSLNRHLL